MGRRYPGVPQESAGILDERRKLLFQAAKFSPYIVGFFRLSIGIHVDSVKSTLCDGAAVLLHQAQPPGALQIHIIERIDKSHGVIGRTVQPPIAVLLPKGTTGGINRAVGHSQHSPLVTGSDFLTYDRKLILLAHHILILIAWGYQRIVPPGPVVKLHMVNMILCQSFHITVIFRQKVAEKAIAYHASTHVYRRLQTSQRMLLCTQGDFHPISACLKGRQTEAEITAGNRLCSLLKLFFQMEKTPFQMVSRCLMDQMQLDWFARFVSALERTKFIHPFTAPSVKPSINCR